MPADERGIADPETLSMGDKVLVCAALPYVNNLPHLGHIVGAYLPADVFARYCRTKGYDTLFVCGSDDNGSATEIAAARLGIPIDRFNTVLHEQHRRIYDWLGMSFDIFSRTSKPLHADMTREFFNDINSKGFIAQRMMKVLYSPKEDLFLPDRYVVGTCPKCGNPEATGDQCERCTTLFNAVDLIDPRSAINGEPLVIRESVHLFLQLDKLSPRIREWVQSQTQWREQVSKLAMGWINEGLKERCITRDIKNGIRVPLKGFENKVFYVWFDAPIGYVSFTKEARPDTWKDYWQSGKGKVFNFVGKDNIPFHTVFWPGMLLVKGDYNLPANVVGLQFLNYEGRKFSKSKSWGVFCRNLIDAGIDSDSIRGALVPLIPETGDVDFRWEAFQNAINSDLLGNYGNLINRTVSFVHSRLGGEVTRPKGLSRQDEELLAKLDEKGRVIGRLIEAADLREAFSEFLSLSSDGNRYFESSKPWALVKEGRERASNVLYVCVSFCKGLSILASPFLPKSADKAWRQLGMEGRADAPGNWDRVSDSLAETHRVGSPELLFEKVTDDLLESFKSKVTREVDLKSLFE